MGENSILTNERLLIGSLTKLASDIGKKKKIAILAIPGDPEGAATSMVVALAQEHLVAETRANLAPVCARQWLMHLLAEMWVALGMETSVEESTVSIEAEAVSSRHRWLFSINVFSQNFRPFWLQTGMHGQYKILLLVVTFLNRRHA